MAATAPLVLVLGATGFTGRSVVNGLLNSGSFRVAALVRQASLSKPVTDELRAAGVEIRVGDINDPPEDLKPVLTGVDILISAVFAFILDAQRAVFQAAKEAGVRRIVPCDWGTPGAPGIRRLHDIKLAIRDFVRELGVGYTFIDVGWWTQTFLPLPTWTPVPAQIKEATWRVCGTGDAPILVTNLDLIGVYVARVVADERTMNQAVIIWDDEVTQNEAYEIGERLSGEGEQLRAKRVHLSEQGLSEARRAAKELVAKNPQELSALMVEAMSDYTLSMHILKENTLENAKKLGYLDVHELYPDMPKHTLEEFARDFYQAKNPGEVYLRDIMLELFK